MIETNLYKTKIILASKVGGILWSSYLKGYKFLQPAFCFCVALARWLDPIVHFTCEIMVYYFLVTEDSGKEAEKSNYYYNGFALIALQGILDHWKKFLLKSSTLLLYQSIISLPG